MCQEQICGCFDPKPQQVGTIYARKAKTPKAITVLGVFSLLTV